MSPATVRQVARSYKLGAEFKALKQQSQIQYVRLLGPLLELEPDCQIDALTAGRVVALADGLPHQASRRPFFKMVTLLYNWARQHDLSELQTGPVDHMIVRAPQKEWIYFIGSGRADPIKIGRARHVGNRLCILQTGNPLVLRVLAAFETLGPASAERALLLKFAAHRIRGEWFTSHPDLWAEIERVTSEGHPMPETRKQHYRQWRHAA